MQNKRLIGFYWSVISIGILALDYLSGPFIQFPFLFILPVALASWQSSRGWGFIIAVGLSVGRLWLVTLWDVPWTLYDSLINAIIRITVLCAFAFLVDIARKKKELAEQVKKLEGMLPICGFCKKIRDDGGNWQQLEEYITRHSEAMFTHSICPECGREHYGDLFARRGSSS